MTMMQEVVRITDRFMDRADPDSIDRQGKLGSVIVLVMIFYAIMGIAFVKMQEMEKKHPRIIHDVDVTFEFTAPPPDPTFKISEMPKPISLIQGENADPGSESAPKPAESDKLSLPTPEAPETLPTPTQQQARPVPSKTTTVAPPVAVATTNMVKAAPMNMPKQAPSAVKTPIAGAASAQQTSGAPVAGGSPDGSEGGTGPGGVGVGGTGSGEGDPGAGKGFGTAGGDVLTSLPPTGARAMGNIAPYRKDLLLRIAQNWHPKKKNQSCTILITLDHDGKLLSDEILESTGSKKADKEALAAIESTEFASLPDWFKGDQLQFKIELAKVEALQQ
jgi:TonB family protein